MKPAQAKQLIGKRVEWEFAPNRARGTCLVRSGILQDVQGRNVMVSGEWQWLPDLTNFKEVDNTENTHKHP